MSLDLDARQRAMLAEMGVKVWQPEPELAPVQAAVPKGGAAPVPVVMARAEAPLPTPARRGLQETPESIANNDRLALGSAEKYAEPVAPRGPADVASGASLTHPAAGVVHLGDVDAMDWSALESAVAGCQACPLGQGRRNTVFGTGDRNADWMVVGEAPGEQEDLQGEPFVGPSGQLLDNMLKAIGLSRHAGAPVQGAVAPDATHAPAHFKGVYIANVVKCRPPGNRNPQPDEVAQCDPYLARQVALVRPKIILAMGRFAVQSLLGTTEPLGRLRGRVHHYQGVPVVVTYHPAYLLRSLPEKGKAWADLCLALEVMQQGGRGD